MTIDEEGAGREVPPLMAEAWTTAVGDEDPLVALGATRALSAHLSLWEARLVQEAVRAGATLEALLGAAQALGDVVAGELDVDPARPRSLGPVDREEARDLAQDVVEMAGLAPRRALEGVAVHGVAGPDDRMAGRAHRAHERRKQLV